MIFFGKCSEVKVVRNKSSKVKYKYKKILLKYSNEVFLLRYYTTLLFPDFEVNLTVKSG